jgi:hypothetical protein
MPHPALRAWLAAAGLCVLAGSAALAQPLGVHAVMCDTADQVEQFAEALLGANLSVEEALAAVGKAAGEPSACVFIPALVDDVHDEKDISYGGVTYVVRRVSVIALMRQTGIGTISQRIDPRTQFSLAVKSPVTQVGRRLLRPRTRL